MGLGSASILTSFFRVKNDKTTRKGEQILEIIDSSEVGILAAWAASRVTSWSDPVLPENPGFQMETHGRTTKVGKPEVYRQTRQKTRVLLVRCIILGLGTSANPQHDTYFPVQPQVSRQNLPCAMISTRSYYSIVIVSAQPISIVAWFNDVQRPLLVSVNYIHLVSSRMF